MFGLAVLRLMCSRGEAAIGEGSSGMSTARMASSKISSVSSAGNNALAVNKTLAPVSLYARICRCSKIGRLETW